MSDMEYEFDSEHELVGDTVYKENRDLAMDREYKELHEWETKFAIQNGDDLGNSSKLIPDEK